jgi:MAF protein
MIEVFLASQSPRRQKLLRCLVENFFVLHSEIEELQLANESSQDFVQRLAQEKARSAGNSLKKDNFPGALVIAADTVVVDQGKILGKPKNHTQARRILSQLKGKTHQVVSGIAVYLPAQEEMLSHVVETEVKMREYTDEEIEDYILSGDPFDKAGAYAIQNKDFQPVPVFDDCYANVMGLPLCHLSMMMKKVGYQAVNLVAERCQETIEYQCPVFKEILTGGRG